MSDDAGPTRSERHETRALGHVAELDGIRGLAILLVLLHHTHEVLAPSWTWLPDGGFLGVDVFFVLSGFLITSLLFSEYTRTRRLRFANFYLRRALRLLPALFVLLLAHLFYAYVTGLPRGQERSGVLSIAFYYSNWQVAYRLRSAPGLGGLWSLAVEEQFYFVWPFILLALLAWLRRPTIIAAALALGAAAVAVHRAQLWHAGLSWLPLYIRTDTRADPLLIGAAAAILWNACKIPRQGAALAGSIGAAFLMFSVYFFSFTDGFFYSGGFILIALAVGAMIVASLETNWFARPFLRMQGLRAVGRVSYGLYLWHIAVFFAVARYTTTWTVVPRVLFAYALTVTATLLSWRLVERPALASKDRRARPGSLHASSIREDRNE